jgi:proteasome lid subunit RPN8/RPN11
LAGGGNGGPPFEAHGVIPATGAGNNLTLVGIYHSHPDHHAMPSESDRLGAYPYLSYVIIAVTNQKFEDIRSWRLNASARFEEELISNQITN